MSKFIKINNPIVNLINVNRFLAQSCYTNSEQSLKKIFIWREHELYINISYGIAKHISKLINSMYLAI